MTPDVYERDFNLPAGPRHELRRRPAGRVPRNPTPSSPSYETAVPGLYLTGAATFPGAGVWGASGRNCATVVLEHDPATGTDVRLVTSRGATRNVGRRTGVARVTRHQDGSPQRASCDGSLSLGHLGGIHLRIHWSASVIASSSAPASPV